MRYFNRFIAYGLIVTVLGLTGCFFGRGDHAGPHGGEGEGEHHLTSR
jgi:hypothetical protein